MNLQNCKLAFIGLGNMGGPMATNLLKSGYDLNLYDIDADKLADVAQHGGKVSKSSHDAVSNADIVLTSLPSPAVIQSMALGDDGWSGILSKMQPDAVWIELSTNNLEVERAVRAAAPHIHMLDAPISGGTEGAAQGTLTIMVGGEQDIFQKVLPVLECIGKDVRHLGKHGAGYVAKIAQVVLCYLHSVALSEALMLGVKGGVPADTMLSIIQNSTGRSYVADRYGPPLLTGSYDPGFTLGLAHKDMRLTLELAASIDANLPMCELVEDIYARASDIYGTAQNHLAAIKLLEDNNDQLLRSS